MKHLLVVFALSLFPAAICGARQTATPAPAPSVSTNPADQPATAADIERYFEATHVREMMKSSMNAVSTQMRQMMHAELEKTPNLPPNAEAQMDQIYDNATQNMPIEDLLHVMEPIYEKHFTKGEIDAIVAFYNSPAGEKLVAEQPAITQEAMQAASGVIQRYVQQTTKQAAAEISKMQIQLPAPSATPSQNQSQPAQQPAPQTPAPSTAPPVSSSPNTQ